MVFLGQRNPRLKPAARLLAAGMLSAGILLPGPAHGQAVQISDRQGLDSLTGLVAVPNGSHAVYVIRDAETGEQRWYAAPIDGSGPQSALGPDLSGSTEAYRGLIEFNPDGQSVAILAQNNGSFSDSSVYIVPFSDPASSTEVGRSPVSNGAWRSYGFAGDTLVFVGNPPAGSNTQRVITVPGTAPHLPAVAAVLPASTGAGQVSDLEVSANNEWAILTYPESGHTFNLYSLKLDGTEPLRRLTDVPDTSDAIIRGLSPDGRYALYRYAPEGTTPRNRYLRPTDGSAPEVELPGDFSFQFTGDGQRVIRRDAINALLVTPVDNPTLTYSVDSATTYDIGSAWKLNPAGTTVVYTGRPSGQTDDRLYSASTLTTGTEVQLSTAAPFGEVEGFSLSDNGQHAVYRERNLTTRDERLYLAQVGVQSNPTLLMQIDAEPFGSQPSALFSSYSFTGNDTYITYRARSPESSSGTDLYFAATDGSTPAKRVFYGHPAGPGQTFSYSYLGEVVDGHALVSTVTRIGSQSRSALFAVPVDGGVPIRLHDLLPANGTVELVQYHEASGKVVFSASTAVVGEAFQASIGFNGGGPFIRYTPYNDVFAAGLPTQPLSLADLTGDFTLDADDIDAFITAQLYPQQYAYRYGLSPRHYAGLNGDDQFDEDDVAPFASLMGVDPGELLARLVSLPGDLNGDGQLTADDIDPFVMALTDPLAYDEQFAGLDPDLLGDMDGSGTLTNTDIYGFVAALTSSVPAQELELPEALAAFVPEPASLAVMTGLAGLLLTRRRRGDHAFP